jgi:hypothetical protein
MPLLAGLGSSDPPGQACTRAEALNGSRADRAIIPPLKSIGIKLMLTVHHLGISQSDRIVWLCEELGVTYTLKRYNRDPVTHLAPA